MKTRVTVGLCVKNCEKTIQEAIQSVINQSIPHSLMEVIVVNGVSKDKTVSIVKYEMSKTDLDAMILYDMGKGLGYARQMVVDNAHGEYIFFIDGDVVIENDYLNKLIEFMDKRPKVGISIGSQVYKKGTLVATIRSLYNQITSDDFLGNDATIYRLRALTQVGGFDKNIVFACEDLDVTEKILENGWTFLPNKEAKFFHHPKDNIKDLFLEQIMFGFGAHYVHHKHNKLVNLWKHLPANNFIWGFELASKSYKLQHQKTSFLIPFLLGIQRICWWIGFIESDITGYGH